MAKFELIDSAEAVEKLAAQLKDERVIAVDTEADSFFHYYDKLCLLQIGTRSANYLIDPLELPEGGLDALGPVLGDPGVRKVLHAAEYDIYMLQRYGDLRTRSVFDTMISAQMLGYPAVGLAALVQRHFGVQLSKDQQRTDWSRRPLRQAQLEYAAADVAYLIELSAILEAELREKKRLEWARQEFASLEDRVWPEREFDAEGYLKIKGAKKLSLRNLKVLRELYLMRDKRARARDRPPFKVLGNGTLLELAQKPPTSRRALARRKGVTELVLRRLGQDILDAVERGMAGAEHPRLEKRPAGGRKRLDRRAEVALERLKRWRARRAAELEMDPGVFCPNAALEEIALEAPRSATDLRKLENLKGWWLEAFGTELIEALARLDAETERAAQRAPAQDPAASPAARRRPRRRGRRRAS
jgi:ribonuclease D